MWMLSVLIKGFEGWVRTSKMHNELKGHPTQTAGTTAERHVVSDALLERSTGTLRVRFPALRGLAKASGLNPSIAVRASCTKNSANSGRLGLLLAELLVSCRRVGRQQ